MDRIAPNIVLAGLLNRGIPFREDVGRRGLAGRGVDCFGDCSSFGRTS